MDNPNYYDLDPSPCILILRIIVFFHKKVSLMMVIVNIEVYKRNIWNLTMWPVCKYLQYIYIYINKCNTFNVCMYAYVYVYM